MLKILHVVPTYLPATRYGGPIYSVHGLCRALACLGHEVHVFTTNVDGSGNSDVPLGEPVVLDGVHVWYFPSEFGRRLYWSPPLYRQLRSELSTFDIVHLHSVFLWPTWIAARLARAQGVPYVLAPRGMLVKELIRRKSRWLKSTWIKLIETRNIESAAFIHATSSIEIEEFKQFRFRQDDIRLVPNGIDLPQSYNLDKISEDVRAVIAGTGYILFLGRLNWKKGLGRLIAAMEEVHGHRLLIVGNDEEGYLDTLKRQIAEHGVGERVNVISRFVDGADREALYANARLFVLPSYSENFGNTVPEAMVRGCPVVVTREVGAAELVEASAGGAVVTANELASTIAELLADDQGLKRAGSRAQQWAEDNLQWSRVACAMAGEYERFLNA